MHAYDRAGKGIWDLETSGNMISFGLLIMSLLCMALLVPKLIPDQFWDLTNLSSSKPAAQGNQKETSSYPTFCGPDVSFVPTPSNDKDVEYSVFLVTQQLWIKFPTRLKIIIKLKKNTSLLPYDLNRQELKQKREGVQATKSSLEEKRKTWEVNNRFICIYTREELTTAGWEEAGLVRE